MSRNWLLKQRTRNRKYRCCSTEELSWRSASELVGVSLVRELFGVIAADKLSEGVFATTSNFTPDARTFAAANNIALLTTAELLEQLTRLPPENIREILEQVTAGDYTTPSCPQCDRKMIWKDKAGFWGCPKYPACRSSPIYPRSRATE